MTKKKTKRINHGGRFQEDIQNSAANQNVWFMRIKDVNIPFKYRAFIKVPRNEYDSLLFYNNHLICVELKSTQAKSVSFAEEIIRPHQIENLHKASQYDGVIAGFLMNFREYDNQTFFIPIDRFIKFKNIAENQLDHTYKSKVNKASISLDICKEIGFEIFNKKLQVRYRYYITDLLEQLIIHNHIEKENTPVK